MTSQSVYETSPCIPQSFMCIMYNVRVAYFDVRTYVVASVDFSIYLNEILNLRLLQVSSFNGKMNALNEVGVLIQI